jgi:outer membrane protein OmpA-like peptidoglycan-associated protein
VGGLFKKIGEHIKRKAGDVTTETAQRLAGTATQVVDTTLETGSGLVSSTAAEAGNKARMTIGGVGRSLMPEALRGGNGSDNLATVLASGHAVLRMIRFTGATDVLEPSSRELAKRLAGALHRIPGTFVIEAHVDPLLSPAASQQLSEDRAAAVKRALIAHGVQAERLIALGYGASEPQPEVPPEGGSPSSARIEVLRAQ